MPKYWKQDHCVPRMLRAIRTLTRRQKIFLAVAVDAVGSIAVGMFIAYFLSNAALPLDVGAQASLAAAAAALVMITLLGGYATVIRFMTSSNSFLFAMGSLFGALTWLFVIQRVSEISPFAGILYLVMLFCITFGSRFALGALNKRYGDDNSRPVPVAIYGTGVSGRQLAAYLNSEGYYRPVAFLDDNPALHGLKISGLRVYPPRHVVALSKNATVKEVLLALPSVSPKRRSEILLMLSENLICVRTVPSLVEMLSGKARLDELRPVDMEDVLSRDPVLPEYSLMSRNLQNRAVLVTGAGGSIGSELCRLILEQKPRALILLDMSEHALFQIEQELCAKLLTSGKRDTDLYCLLGSVENAGLIRHVLQAYRINTVFHAAAYKHVPLVEMNVIEGVRNNVLGTKVLLEAINESGVSTFVMISSDKAVRPTNVMGASKRVAELLVQATANESSCDMSIVRFGNVLGSSGSVLPMFHAQIRAGGPITVTHRDVTRFFMTIREAAQLVIQACALSERGDVFHLDMGEPVRILDLARRLLRLHGLRERTPDQDGDIEISIIGLRSGEKLYEELLIDGDARPTLHPRIFRAREKYLSRDELYPLVDRLLAACQIRDEVAVISLLQKIVEGCELHSANGNVFRTEGEAADSPGTSGSRSSEATLAIPFRTKSIH